MADEESFKSTASGKGVSFKTDKTDASTPGSPGSPSSPKARRPFDGDASAGDGPKVSRTKRLSLPGVRMPRGHWGNINEKLHEMDELAEAEAEGLGKAMRRPSVRAALTNPEIQDIRISKRGGGGTRTLTWKEQLLLKAIMKPAEDREDDDVDLIVRAVRAIPLPTLRASRRRAARDRAGVARARASSSLPPLTPPPARAPRSQTSDIKFFQRLTQAQHYALCREMGYAIHENGTTLFNQGDEGSTFYVVYRGCCKLFVTDENMNWSRMCVATMDDGTSFGELALLGDGKRSATATFASRTIVFTVEKDSYDAVLLKVRTRTRWPLPPARLPPRESPARL